MPKKRFSDLLKQAERGHAAAVNDFDNELWLTHSRHLKTYNMVLREALRFPAFRGLSPIAAVPKWQGQGRPSALERAKLSEIVQGFKMLLAALQSESNVPEQSTDSAISIVVRVMDRFHLVAQRLQVKTAGQRSWRIRSEYDVQQLVHALLLLHFDDVRAEEHTPSYAGGAARMDFLIRFHDIVVETKMTRAGLEGKVLGEELLIDIARYENHSNCNALCCLIYDPCARVKNPRGLEADLMRKAKPNLIIKVFVRP
jgi:hypothetical protein